MLTPGESERIRGEADLGGRERESAQRERARQRKRQTKKNMTASTPGNAGRKEGKLKRKKKGGSTPK